MLGDAQSGIFAHWHFVWHFVWHFDTELKCHDLHLFASCRLHDQCG